MGKKIFSDAKGNVHFGVGAPDGFKEASKDEAKKALQKKGSRKFWRCSVCRDLHFNTEPPHDCPTCHNIDTYVEISEKEFRTMMLL